MILKMMIKYLKYQIVKILKNNNSNKTKLSQKSKFSQNKNFKNNHNFK